MPPLVPAALFAAAWFSAPSVFAANPTISAFAPGAAKLNTPITIVGTNFVAPVKVFFNGTQAASVTVVSSVQLTAYVPLTATSGKITVTAAGGSIVSPATFTVVPGVTLSAAVGGPGATPTLYYSSFGAYEAVDVYCDTEDIALTTASAVGAGVIYAPSDDDSLYALNAATGTKIWSYATAGTINASPALVGGLVCIGSDDQYLHALDAATGSQRWEYKTGAAVGGCPAVQGSTIFFGGIDQNVYALNANGTVRWTTAVDNTVVGPLCVANGVVYASDYGNTYVLDSDTGALLTVLPVGCTYGGPAVVNGAVYVCDAIDSVLTRYAPNATQASAVAERPEPARLVPRELR